jgi:hypothetical protein
LTDEESDDGNGFELIVPALADLLTEFEMGDEALLAREMEMKQNAADLKSRGLKPQLREDITLTKEKRKELLNSNIAQHKA